jgi:hypothetical protein
MTGHFYVLTASLIRLHIIESNGAACDTDNNKLHNEKTSQLTKG